MENITNSDLAHFQLSTFRQSRLFSSVHYRAGRLRFKYKSFDAKTAERHMVFLNSNGPSYDSEFVMPPEIDPSLIFTFKESNPVWPDSLDDSSKRKPMRSTFLCCLMDVNKVLDNLVRYTKIWGNGIRRISCGKAKQKFTREYAGWSIWLIGPLLVFDQIV